MERFVRFVLAGGLALLVGLWLARLFAPWTAVWFAGLALAVLGCGSLAYGIGSQLRITRWS